MATELAENPSTERSKTANKKKKKKKKMWWWCIFFLSDGRIISGWYFCMSGDLIEFERSLDR